MMLLLLGLAMGGGLVFLALWGRLSERHWRDWETLLNTNDQVLLTRMSGQLDGSLAMADYAYARAEQQRAVGSVDEAISLIELGYATIERAAPDLLRLIAGMAESYYTPLAPHNPQGPCSLAARCQIAAEIPNFLVQEQGTKSYDNMLKNPFQVEKGFLPISTLPGLGIEFDEAKFMSLVGEPEPYRRTYDRDDGSVVDW